MPAESCEQALVQAGAPERLIKGGLPTEAMVAYVLVAKYAWHTDLTSPTRDIISPELPPNADPAYNAPDHLRV